MSAKNSSSPTLKRPKSPEKSSLRNKFPSPSKTESPAPSKVTRFNTIKKSPSSKLGSKSVSRFGKKSSSPIKIKQIQTDEERPSTDKGAKPQQLHIGKGSIRTEQLKMMMPSQLDKNLAPNLEFDKGFANAYKHSLAAKSGDPAVVAEGTQVVVTEYSLDFYIAQEFGINLDGRRNRSYNIESLIERKKITDDLKKSKQSAAVRDEAHKHVPKAIIEYPKTMKVLGLAESEALQQSEIYCNICDREIRASDGYYACNKADIDCDYSACAECYLRETLGPIKQKMNCDSGDLLARRETVRMRMFKNGSVPIKRAVDQMSKEQDTFFRGVEKIKRDSNYKLTHEQAVEHYLQLVERKRRDSQLKLGEQNYAHKRAMQNLMLAKVGVKDAATIARLQSGNLSMIELQKTVVGQKQKKQIDQKSQDKSFYETQTINTNKLDIRTSDELKTLNQTQNVNFQVSATKSGRSAQQRQKQARLHKRIFSLVPDQMKDEVLFDYRDNATVDKTNRNSSRFNTKHLSKSNISGAKKQSPAFADQTIVGSTFSTTLIQSQHTSRQQTRLQSAHVTKSAANPIFQTLDVSNQRKSLHAKKLTQTNLKSSGAFTTNANVQQLHQNVSNTFSSTMCKHRRDEILHSIDAQLQPVKTFVTQTAIQKKRELQTCSHSQYGSRQLQTNLNRKGVTSNRRLAISSECRQTLSEINFINENITHAAQRMDAEVRKHTLPPAEVFQSLDQDTKDKMQGIERECAWRAFDSRNLFMERIKTKDFTQRISSRKQEDFEGKRKQNQLLTQDTATDYVSQLQPQRRSIFHQSKRASVFSEHSAVPTERSNRESMSHKSTMENYRQNAARKQVIKQILEELDNLEDEQPSVCHPEFTLWPPELTLNIEEMRKHIPDMDDARFWLQQAQKQINNGKIEWAIDYYRRGLRRNPTSLSLIYAMSLCFYRLCWINSAFKWLNFGLVLSPQWVDGFAFLTCVLIREFKNFEALDSILKAQEFYSVRTQFYELFNQQYQTNTNESIEMNTESDCQVKKSNHLFAEERIIFMVSLCYRICDNKTKCQEMYLVESIKELAKKSIHEESELEKYQTKEFTKKNKSDRVIKKAMGKQNVINVFGLILMLSTDQRKDLVDHIEAFKQMLDLQPGHNQGKYIQSQLMLRRYCKYPDGDENAKRSIIKGNGQLNFSEVGEQPPQLNFEMYEQSILHLLSTKSFFKRFTPEQLKQSLSSARVAYYRKDELVFKNGYIGVITHGSILICQHPHKPDGPTTLIKRAYEGDVIGFFEGDNGITCSPLTMMLSYEDHTEIVLIEAHVFADLWKKQQNMTEQQICLRDLETNEYFKELNLLTKYMLVFEHIEQKIYFPGEIIMSVTQRSPICTGYFKFYQDQETKFMMTLENKKQETQNRKTKETKQKFAQLSKKAGINIMAMIVGEQLQSETAKTSVQLIKENEKIQELEIINSFESDGEDMGLEQAKSLLDKHTLTQPKGQISNDSDLESLPSDDDTMKSPLIQQNTQFSETSSIQKKVQRREQRDQLQFLKFMLQTYIQKLSKTSKMSREQIKIKIDYVQRKNLIVGLHMFLKKLLNNLKNANQSESVFKIIHEQNAMLTMIESALRTKLLINLEMRKDEMCTELTKIPGGVQHINQIQLLMDTLNQVKMQMIQMHYKNLEGERTLLVEEYKLLMHEIMKQIKFQLNGWGHQRVEPNGVHFITSGNALVLDHQRIWVKLSKCDCFGHSPMVKEIGPEHFGDVRAGLKPVSTYFIKYTDFYHRISYGEMAKLKTIAKNDKQLEMLIGQLAKSYNINPDVLRRY